MIVGGDEKTYLTPVEKAWRYFQLNDELPVNRGFERTYISARQVNDERLKAVYAQWFGANTSGSGNWDQFAHKFQSTKTYADINTDKQDGVSFDEFCSALGAAYAGGHYALTFQSLKSAAVFGNEEKPFVLAEPEKTRALLDMLPKPEFIMPRIRTANIADPEKAAALRRDLRADIKAFSQTLTENTAGLDETDGSAALPIFKDMGYLFKWLDNGGGMNSSGDGLATAEDIASCVETLYDIWTPDMKNGLNDSVKKLKIDDADLAEGLKTKPAKPSKTDDEKENDEDHTAKLSGCDAIAKLPQDGYLPTEMIQDFVLRAYQYVLHGRRDAKNKDNYGLRCLLALKSVIAGNYQSLDQLLIEEISGELKKLDEYKDKTVIVSDISCLKGQIDSKLDDALAKVQWRRDEVTTLPEN